MTQTPLRICTRKSELALWQAERVRALFAARGVATELLPLSTKGDRVLDRALSEVGGKGLFVKELEDALLAGRADLAVHSAKDVPFTLAPAFSLCAFPLREDARDAMIAPAARTFEALPWRARVGTSSLRRAAQLLAVRPDLEIVPVRGNVATRLSFATGRRADGAQRPPSERLDAVVLALAGLRRLGLEEHVTQALPIDLCLPAAGQGALAIETLRGSRADLLCEELNDLEISRCVRAERAVLARLGGSCTVPIGAHATIERSSEYGGAPHLRLRAVLGGPGADGVIQLLRDEATDELDAGESLGETVAEMLLAQGGARLLAAGAASHGLPAPKRSTQ